MSSKAQHIDRRTLLKNGALTAALGGLAFLSKPGQALAAKSSCAVTPPQTEGPFYPVNEQLDTNNDLTFVEGGTAKATGDIIYISGTVVDSKCMPVAGALVEIWQACASGRYNHPNDPNQAPLDPNFQYWGKAVTDQNGSYLFKTILPGAYPAAPGWMRPPHIHFRVLKVGYHELTSQLYFDGNPLNRKDRILQALSPSEQKSVTVALAAADPASFGPNAKSGRFDITLKEV